jgi:hypothetical protein
MPKYRLDVLAPDARLLHRREFQAADDAEAKKCADERWREFVKHYQHAEGVTLDRYVSMKSVSFMST